MSELEPGAITVVLFRPVGPVELKLIEASGFREFPPRLDHQPIFYPVLSEEYAHEIARRWNAEHPTSGGVGFVTRFQVRASHLARYPIQTVGGRTRQEYWIPADELAEFNKHILGPIEVIGRYDRAVKP
jgi:hypothetical protein